MGPLGAGEEGKQKPGDAGIPERGNSWMGPAWERRGRRGVAGADLGEPAAGSCLQHGCWSTRAGPSAARGGVEERGCGHESRQGHKVRAARSEAAEGPPAWSSPPTRGRAGICGGVDSAELRAAKCFRTDWPLPFEFPGVGKFPWRVVSTAGSGPGPGALGGGSDGRPTPSSCAKHTRVS